MADLKISAMPSASSVADADVVPVVQGGANKKSAMSVIKTYLSAAYDAIYVPLTRSLTINGVAHDLSADRSWTVSTGVSTFTALTDCPASYSGQTLKSVRVNTGETGLEFYTPGSTTQIGSVSFGFKRSTGITTGKLGGYWTCPYAGNITAWNLTVDTGTITIKVWKIAAGTAHPTNANSINTSGISLSTGTHIRSTTLSDFTSTVVTAGDTFAIEVTSVSGVLDIGGSIEITH